MTRFTDHRSRTRKAFRNWRSWASKNVLSFRDYHADDGGFGLTLYRVRMGAGDIKVGKVVEALRIIKNSDGSILIHCWYGSDRTGLISTLYRILFQGWPKESALGELMHGGYGYHSMYKNIPKCIRKVDVEEMKK